MPWAQENNSDQHLCGDTPISNPWPALQRWVNFLSSQKPIFTAHGYPFKTSQIPKCPCPTMPSKWVVEHSQQPARTCNTEGRTGTSLYLSLFPSAQHRAGQNIKRWAKEWWTHCKIRQTTLPFWPNRKLHTTQVSEKQMFNQSRCSFSV